MKFPRATEQKTMGNVIHFHGQQNSKRRATKIKTTGNEIQNDVRRLFSTLHIPPMKRLCRSAQSHRIDIIVEQKRTESGILHHLLTHLFQIGAKGRNAGGRLDLQDNLAQIERLDARDRRGNRA